MLLWPAVFFTEAPSRVLGRDSALAQAGSAADALFAFQHIHKFLNESWRKRYQAALSPGMLTLLWSTVASIFSLGGLFGAQLGGSLAIRLGR